MDASWHDELRQRRTQERAEVAALLQRGHDAYAQALAQAAVFIYDDNPDWIDFALGALHADVMLRICRLWETHGAGPLPENGDS